jgi:hypothetical protein
MRVISKRKRQSYLTEMGGYKKFCNKRPFWGQANWVAAGKLRNYILNDPLLDWLDVHFKSGRKVTARLPCKPSSVNHVLFKSGLEFEAQVVNYIRNTMQERYEKHCFVDLDYVKDLAQRAEITKQHIVQGTPIIYQGYLFCHKDKVHGAPDLLIRSDYINRLVTKPVLSRSEIRAKASITNGPYHYCVVDIKAFTLPFRSDEIHLKNNTSTRPSKGQLWVYTHCLNQLQGFGENRAFIWGHQADIKGNRYPNHYYTLGRISYDSVDESMVDISKKAISWIRDVRSKGHNWKLTSHPLPREELYPNMSNYSDNPWRMVKQFIAQQIGEITLLPFCGSKQRAISHQQGNYQWHDYDTSQRSSKMSQRIDSVIKANQGPGVLYPNKVGKEVRDYLREGRSYVEVFLDIETVRDTKVHPRHPIVFLLGMGRIKLGEWRYSHWLMSELSKREEKKIIKQWLSHLAALAKNKKGVIVYHWGHYERTQLSKVIEDYKLTWPARVEWRDVCQFMVQSNIAVRGSFSYKLKDVAGVLSDLKLPDSCPSNGLATTQQATKLYQEKKKVSKKDMKDIITYNELDCHYVEHILEKLRKQYLR